ncbi:MAG: L-threonylcarbamoyladenylate synthase [Bacteroidota bacterium]
MSAKIISDYLLAASALSEGKLVALPTETVYGLGANALDEVAASKIFAAKNRPSFDPLIIHQSNWERLRAYVKEVPPAAKLLADTFWPGPLTLVLPKTDLVPELISAGLPTVAIRAPAHPLTRAVLAELNFPVAAPSANPFGFVSPTTAQHVADQLGSKIDYILDGGPCVVGLESTIIGFPKGEPTIFRKGGLAVEAIEAVLGKPIAIRTHSSSRPEAPGMLSRHYSPGAPMEIFPDLSEAPESALTNARIVFNHGGQPMSIQGMTTTYDLSPSGDLAEAARRLFTVLRQIAEQNFSYVAVVLLPETGLGRAINDRLRRAAARE